MSQNNDAYDPNAPEGEISSRGQYMTKRDLRSIAIVLVVLGALGYPIYLFMLKRSESSRCTQNMKAIQEAIALYEDEHDGRLPPIDRTENVDSLTPSLGDSGHVYTWASDVAGYKTARASFLCPSAKPEEVTWIEDPDNAKQFLPLSYGMYAPYGGFLASLIENPDQTIIVAETSNSGALSTYDPMPFKSSDGKPLPDGFVIGWNDGNDAPTKSSQWMTRLALPGTADGKFSKDGDARHGDTIHMLTASGQEVNGNQMSAKFKEAMGVSASWTVPPTTRATR
ncbi:MAG TPA: hypothetical protein VG944_13775 [Fimbriimonas sp.]|nr:hypothetical protein [Fimbriimonas sp.]